MTWNAIAIVASLICGLGVFLFAAFLVWGIFHLRGSQRQAEADIKKVTLDQIEPLAQECIQVFRDKFDVDLDLVDWETAAEKLDAALADSSKIKDTFARDDFYWYFVLPVGAFLGELLRLHGQHRWVKTANEAPSMIAKLPYGETTTYPFEKVIKHIRSGEPGDIAAYVVFACTSDDAD